MIQSGGSETASNAAELSPQQDMEGARVGGAPRKADVFGVIVKAAEAEKRA
ncbi:triose-phosphate isomerase [Enterobacter bugandensis]|uniref:triose-phosphate isomerase n=1 Tax=Enterobacter bugandensis TaxID=881260 RepID=UPI003F6DDC3D